MITSTDEVNLNNVILYDGENLTSISDNINLNNTISYDSINTVLNDINIFGKENFIIVNGGIGDFLSIDVFFNYSITKNIIFITTQSLVLKRICTFYNGKNKKYYAVYFNFSMLNITGFLKKQLIYYFPCFSHVDIVDTWEYFDIIRNSNLNYNIQKNVIFKKINNNVKEKFKIPDIFAIIVPYTEDIKIFCLKCNLEHSNINSCVLTRNFIGRDYLNVINFLKKNKIVGVIISLKKINIPKQYDDGLLINLSNKLNIEDCIELAKECTYYFGIDGAFAIIVHKILSSNNICIKSNNACAYNNQDIYYYPHKNVNIKNFITI